MLYRVLGKVNSGTSLWSLNKVINSKYDNVSYISLEISTKNILKRCSNYKKNTNKLIVNKLLVKQLSPLTDYSTIETYILNSIEENINCVVIDKLHLIKGDKSIIVENLTTLSKDNNIDIILIESSNNVNKKFEEAIKELEEMELIDNQDFVLVHKENIEEYETYYTRTYERRSNIIRHFNIKVFNS